MWHFIEFVQLALSFSQAVRRIRARALACIHAVAVSLELWSRPSQDVADLLNQNDFDELLVFSIYLALFTLVAALLAAFASGACLAWSCARARERPRARAMTSAASRSTAPLTAPRSRTPLPAFPQVQAQRSELGSARRRSRSDPPTPTKLDFNPREHQVEHFPVPLCSPRAAPSARGVSRQPSGEEETNSSQGSRCRLRRIMYSP